MAYKRRQAVAPPTGGAAPVGAQFITAAADPTLTAERVLTNTGTVTWDFTTPGQALATASLTKAQVGLGNADNTSDVNKPISTATQTALNLKLDIAAESFAFSNVAVATQATIVADALTDTLTIAAGANVTLTTDAATDTLTINSAQPPQNTFSNVAVATQPTIVADSATDTLTIVAGTNITLTTDAATDTLTIAAVVPAAAPVGAEYIVSASDPTLTAERVLTDTATVTWNFATAGQAQATAVGAAQNTFLNIAVATQPTIVADTSTDTLTIVAGSGITITTDATTDTLTINSAAAGSFSTLAVSGATTLSGGLNIPSGGVINWASGDVTLTHSPNLLEFSGASGGYAFAEPIRAVTGGTALLIMGGTGGADGSYMQLNGLSNINYPGLGSVQFIIRTAAGADDTERSKFAIRSYDGTTFTERVKIYGNTGQIGLSVTPTARLHIAAGTATAGTSPLKLDSGPLLTTPEVGAEERLGNDRYYTGADGVRRTYITSAGTANWIEAGSIAAPNNVVGAVVWRAVSTLANSDAAIEPKGTGAFLLQIPDSAAAGGNKRGTYAVDLQRNRLNVTEVASGANSVVGGGRENTSAGPDAVVGGGRFNQANTVASTVPGGQSNIINSDYGTIGGGLSNTINTTTTYGTIGGGRLNSVLGLHSTVSGGRGNAAQAESASVGGGNNNVANNIYATVSGGQDNIVPSPYGLIPGGRGATTRAISGAAAWSGQKAFGTGALGDSQEGKYLLKVEMTGTTATRLSTDQAAASATNQIVLPDNSSFVFAGEMVARNAANGDTALWRIEGGIRRGVGVGSVVFVGTPTVTVIATDAGAATWLATVTADTTLGCLGVTVAAAAGVTVRAVANLRVIELVY